MWTEDFNEYYSVQYQEWLDDSCGETIEEFETKMKEIEENWNEYCQEMDEWC
ncbi:MAG: hypothetical protein GY928_22175 [Colwellia sp.]|nr:hypothetical protein [Colwellia sp.]